MPYLIRRHFFEFNYRHFQIPFDVNQFTNIAEMADFISDVFEERHSDAEKTNYITLESTEAFLKTMLKKNNMIIKVLIHRTLLMPHYNILIYWWLYYIMFDFFVLANSPE